MRERPLIDNDDKKHILDSHIFLYEYKKIKYDILKNYCRIKYAAISYLI